SWICAAVLLALPACSFHIGNLNAYRGPLPHNGAVFCEIEKRSEPRHCAGGDELLLGIPLSHAAIAFTVADVSNIGLDYSPDAKARCGGGPEAVTFEGPFPDGYPVCLNCLATIGPVFPDTNAVCVFQCEGLTLNNH